ncbi:MAG TPA: PIG-L family deacetylase [Pyrinomonadaceae bacterium]|nr:PIG-L family deacetylase [Pyrinomonadaceae bacterium]
MRKLLPFLILFAAFSAYGQKKTLLAIFPHSDDESTVAEVLIKYSELGYRVQVITATDGRYGTRITKVPAGEELARLRKEESLCAAKKLGIEEPIFFGIERLDTLIGVGKYFAEHKRLLKLLKEKISELDPEFIITFGPDGDTSHSEHIVTGAAVTELIIREGWVEKYPLYYVAWPKAIGEASDLGYVHEKYMNVRIDYSQALEDRALEIMPCYVTQFTPEEIKEDREKKIADRSNVAYFRQLVVKKGLRNNF